MDGKRINKTGDNEAEGPIRNTRLTNYFLKGTRARLTPRI
jgi:hypothetical protein